MRKIIFILALMPFVATAQSASTKQVTLKAGTDGYVTINGQDYPRGYLLTNYTYRTNDSLVAIYYANTRTQFIPPTIDTAFLYVDTADKKARNMITLRGWFNTYFDAK